MPCYFLCNRSFWNEFCQPQNPGVYIALTLAIADLVYTCIIVSMSAYYDNFSNAQHIGYLTLLCGNIVVSITALLTIHFLSLRPSRLRLSYYIFLHVALVVAGLLGATAVVTMYLAPSTKELLIHAQRAVRIYHKAPYFIDQLLLEKECCGIKKYGDIFSTFTRPDPLADDSPVKFYRIPSSCCRTSGKSKKEIKDCHEWLKDLIEEPNYIADHEMYLNLKPCLEENKGFSSLRGTNAVKTYYLTVTVVFPIFPIIIGLLIILNYYVCFKFPKREITSRPIRFLNELEYLGKCKCRALRDSLRARKHMDLHDASIYGAGNEKRMGEFAAIHHLISKSMGHMKIQKEERIREKEMYQARIYQSANVTNESNPKPANAEVPNVEPTSIEK